MEDQIQLSKKEFQKMIFIMNALNDGWKVEKMVDEYIFTKKHEGKREIYKTDYLEKFIYNNLDIQRFSTSSKI
jgi:hypothetical protein